jgi:hypothetical protein
VPGNSTVIGFGRTLTDHDHVPELASVVRSLARTSLDTPSPQAASQLASQLATSLDEQRLVDGLVTHMHHRIVGELHPQPVRDLLRRPLLLQPVGDPRRQPGAVELERLGPSRPRAGTLVSAQGPVVVPTAIDAHLP